MAKPMKLGKAIDCVIKMLDGKDLDGKCYHASEAVYHLAGGKASGLTPMRVELDPRLGYSSHWYLRGPRGEIIDLTAGQFEKPLDYSKARGCGFRTKEPSSSCKELMQL